MDIEFARPDDEPQLKLLLAACDLPYQDITPAHLGHFLVLRDGARLAGVVGLEINGRFALLRSLAVPSQYRKQGIASRLTSEAEAYARTQGIIALYLLTTTAPGFFTRRGYRRVERATAPAEIQGTAEFKSICPSSSVCLVKQLVLAEPHE